MGGTAESFDAALVRLVGSRPDGRPDFEEVASLEPAPLNRSASPWAAGSYVEVGPAEEIAGLRSFTAACWVYPTLLTPRPQVLFATGSERRAGWSLLLDGERGPGLRLAEEPEVFADIPLAERRWTHVSVSWDATAGRIRFVCAERDGVAVEREATLAATPQDGEAVLRIAAPHGPVGPVTDRGSGCFNGKLSEPLLYATALGDGEVAAVRERGRETIADAPLCAPDFADAIGAHEFSDRSGHEHRVKVVNSPTPAVTGPRWRAHTSSYLEDRGQYAALHFHDDDVDDIGWPASHRVQVPADAASGAYAVRLTTADCEDWVPFFVTDPSTSTADAVLLLPTLTYLAYANEHEILSNPPSYTAFTGRDSADAPLGWRDWLAVDTGMVSLYDVHRDGSTVSYASSRRPLLNLRPDYVWPLLDAPHGPGLDLRLMGLLDRGRVPFDVLTDHDLDEAGLAALEPYRLVITGGHPEYWTAAMLDALDAFVAGGGRVAYLGGNGFYGVTGIDPARRHIAEVRRPLFGSRPSSSEPGETWMTTTGEEGGMWRARGRPPQQRVGVGTTSMGAGPGRGFRRREASYEPAYSWVFDGVDGELIGAEGGILGGVAAYEFDRADPQLGTPEHAEVLATASGFERLYYPLLEDFVGSNPEVADPGSPLVRADMVMMIGENGGGAFSVGTAAWCGSLGTAEEPTDVARITENVVRRFATTPTGEDPLRRTEVAA